MTFKNNYEYTISLTQHLDAVFLDCKLPTNSFIHKGRCGIGGTTLEIKYPRHSIITVPNNQIIRDKQEETELMRYDIFAVEGGVTAGMIRAHILKTINTPGAHVKIMSTPDSFYKIIDAANNLYGFNIYKDCFLLLDECHSFVTDAFRKAILLPFKWFWEFTDKSVISATPYYFTDARFKQFDYHRVKFVEPYIGEVNIVRATSVRACLNHALTKEIYPGNVHVFYNSVTETIRAIKRAELTDGNMFFSDKEENHEKLNGFSNFYQDQPSQYIYKKFNFYTCKYNEGWNLLDDQATIIIVTDLNSPHTKIRISNKGVQAVGRSRIPPKQIYHITNHRNTNKVKTQEQISNDYEMQAIGFIKLYNQIISQGCEPIPEFKTQVAKFADIDLEAVYNSYKFDQMVNEQLCNEEFADMEIIGQQWEVGLYKPVHWIHEERLTKINTLDKRKSKADKLKGKIEEFERIEQEKEQFAFNLGYDELDELKALNPFAWEAYKELGKAKLIQLGYKENAIKIALIEKTNLTAEMKLKKLLNITFKVNHGYTKSEIKQTLQRLYNKVGLKDKHGDIKIATAEQLGESARFDIEESKKKVDDKWMPAFKILRAQFELKLAA
jgi:ribosomal protein L23